MIVDKLIGCARCHGNHEHITFRKLTNPVYDSDGTQWTYFAVCPRNQEPILMKQEHVEFLDKTEKT